MKRIDITRDSSGNVKFQTVSIDNTENVFFLNLDPKSAHWPAFFLNKPFTSNLLGPAPSAPSSQCQVPKPAAGTTQVSYGCMLTGHDKERGVINVFQPLAAGVTQLPNAKLNQQIVPQQVVKGGMSPYKITGQLFEVTNGGTVIQSGAGIGPGLQLNPKMDNTGVWVSGAPTVAGTYAFTFTVDDGMGGNLQQVQYSMLVS